MKSRPTLLLSFCLAFARCHRTSAAIAAFLWLLTLAAPVAAGRLDEVKDAESRSDWVAALKLLRPLADEGNAVAQGKLGLFYEEGRGVTVDYTEAAKWLQRSADQGNAESQTNLANLYRLGRGVPLNYAESLIWLQKSAAQHFYGAFLTGCGKTLPSEVGP
jgi:TPR repeat protein